jgi:hypothetical protein
MSGAGLFPPPDKDLPRLSTQFAHGEYRAGPGVKVKWTRRATRSRADCDECTALQHETNGQFWPRRQVRHRRAVNSTTLDLCSAHAVAWKDRDHTEGAVT